MVRAAFRASYLLYHMEPQSFFSGMFSESRHQPPQNLDLTLSRGSLNLLLIRLAEVDRPQGRA